jgi:uncharacterized protein (DUF1778 family)
MMPKVERLEARITKAQKQLFQQAADLEGRSLTDFAIQAIQNAARQTVDRHQTLRMSARDQQVFVAALLRPPEPGKVLLAAAKRYKNRLRSK